MACCEKVERSAVLSKRGAARGAGETYSHDSESPLDSQVVKTVQS